MKDIFLSHNGQDKPWVEQLAFDIENDANGKGLSVFFDQWDIGAGESIPLTLSEGLEQSRFLGLVLSPEGIASRWVALEWASRMMEDRTIIPILRRDCEIPAILKSLKYIDFRDDAQYEQSLGLLLNLLRGEKIERGEGRDMKAVQQQEDRRLLEKHLIIFDRPGFFMPCIMELFLEELTQCVDDSQAALNTGKLFRRDGQLSNEFPAASSYRTAEFQDAVKTIRKLLSQLKFQLNLFASEFKRNLPDYQHHANFYSMLFGLSLKAGKEVLAKTLNQMDQIDSTRNEILVLLNGLQSAASNRRFDPIELSSTILKEERIGGLDDLKATLGW